ncbi:MAG: hypothetical protein AB4050_12735 [Synechococcus sp.]
MTELLQRVFEQIAKLPHKEQDNIARRLLAELEDGKAGLTTTNTVNHGGESIVPSGKDSSPLEKARKFREWVSQQPETGISLPDEAFDRGSIYE